MKRLTDAEYAVRFLSRITLENSAGCRLWTGPLNDNGYGMTWWMGKHRKCNRVAWEVARGEIPNGLHVLHRCDVRSCCNPAHLFLGTHTDNMRDMTAKGRGNKQRGAMHHTRRTPGHMPRGSNNGNSRLSESQVAEILIQHAANRPRQRDLARAYGVSQRLIGNIIHRRTWKHVAINKGSIQ